MEPHPVDLVALCAEAVQTSRTVGPAWPVTFRRPPPHRGVRGRPEPAPGHRQPPGQHPVPHPRGDDRPGLRRTRRLRRRDRGGRRRPGHVPRAGRPRLRALLPLGPQPLTPARWGRSRTVHRVGHRGRPRRHRLGLQRTGPGHHVHGAPAGRATRGPRRRNCRRPPASPGCNLSVRPTRPPPSRCPPRTPPRASTRAPTLRLPREPAPPTVRIHRWHTGHSHGGRDPAHESVPMSDANLSSSGDTVGTAPELEIVVPVYNEARQLAASIIVAADLPRPLVPPGDHRHRGRQRQHRRHLVDRQRPRRQPARRPGAPPRPEGTGSGAPGGLDGQPGPGRGLHGRRPGHRTRRTAAPGRPPPDRPQRRGHRHPPGSGRPRRARGPSRDHLAFLQPAAAHGARCPLQRCPVRLQGPAPRRRRRTCSPSSRTRPGSSTPRCSSPPSVSACASTRCRSTGSTTSTRGWPWPARHGSTCAEWPA